MRVDEDKITLSVQRVTIHYPMNNSFRLPEQFELSLGIQVQNARERLMEAKEIGLKLAKHGVPLTCSPDHFAMFTDPPQLLSGPLKRLGYVPGADNRCYPSPVDGCDYINVAASLPFSSLLREKGWPDHVAVVHPVDDVACTRMLEQGYGNPFIHHITFGIDAPKLPGSGGIVVAEHLIKRMVEVHRSIFILQQSPGTLIIAVPGDILRTPEFPDRFVEWSGKSLDRPIPTGRDGGRRLPLTVLRPSRRANRSCSSPPDPADIQSQERT